VEKETVCLMADRKQRMRKEPVTQYNLQSHIPVTYFLPKTPPPEVSTTSQKTPPTGDQVVNTWGHFAFKP
jgi:hypothetical protein